jgi:hypothetical protein
MLANKKPDGEKQKARSGRMGNSKHEYRNTNGITSIFVFRACLVLRASDFALFLHPAVVWRDEYP